MSLFNERCDELFDELGEYRKMVLSTCFNDYITSRMMSVVIIENAFYFQTDKTFRKYNQLKNNNRAALCIDNFQVEGFCKEIGKPLNNRSFCRLYEKHFYNSFKKYSCLSNEVLFALEPILIKRWIYENGKPYEEIFDFDLKSYHKKAYEAH